MDKKIFVHQGPGHYIGSAIVVSSPSERLAKVVIRRELDSQGLPDEEIKITDKFNLSVTDLTMILYSHNGDY